MTQNRASRRFALALVALAGGSGALIPGCGNPSQAHTPGATVARQALEDSLVAWRAGEKPERLAAHTPPVHPVDSHWQTGQSLAAFEILDEGPDTGDATRRFRVRLTPGSRPGGKAAARDTTTEYVVLGRDPVWVYREDDYTRLLNMDNNPAPPTGRKRR
jgi:hypothetical protein